MYLQLISFSVFLTFVSAWTVQIERYHDHCYYETAEKDAKMGLTYEIVEEPILGIDVSVTGPDGRTVFDRTKDISGKYTFIAYQGGKYKFCFSNLKSPITRTTVMFDVLVGTSIEWRNDYDNDHDKASLEDTVKELGEALRSLSHEQEYSVVRNKLYHQTCERTKNMVVGWALFQLLLVVIGSIFQVSCLKRFFEIQRRV